MFWIKFTHRYFGWHWAQVTMAHGDGYSHTVTKRVRMTLTGLPLVEYAFEYYFLDRDGGAHNHGRRDLKVQPLTWNYPALPGDEGVK